MGTGNSKFSALFKKYRLRAEFDTLSELSLALADKGFIYEESILSRWQRGDRVPNRAVLLKLIEIFAEKQSVESIDQANELLESIGEGYLTSQDFKKISFKSLKSGPFQIPSQIENFTGREELIQEVKKEITSGATIVIYGIAGVGKSALAIHLGYLFRDKFPDGVLWYRLDTSDVMDILLSIAFAFGKDVSYIQDKEIRASTVRSILANKRVLLIFDNADLKNEIDLLLPNNPNSSTIITSRYSGLSISAFYKSVPLESFTFQETLLLFKRILGDGYVLRNKSQVLKLAGKVGFLPLALHIFADELKKEVITIEELLEDIEKDSLSLPDLSYSNKDLFLAINFSYESLEVRLKRAFVSLGIFEGKDFSIESVAYINELSLAETKRILGGLKDVSLIEQSTKTRYRVHPMIKKFVRTKLSESNLFSKAAKYYEQFLSQFDKEFLKSYPYIKQESENVVYIFKKCYELHYWDEVIALWTPLETLLYSTNQLDKMREIFRIVNAQKTGINAFQKILSVYFSLLIIYWIISEFTSLRTDFLGYVYSFLFSLIPLMGGIIGFFIARSWALFKSLMGKAILFLSAGLFSWGIGNLIWAYYNFFLNNPVPYPSLADPAYILSYPLWALGVMNLPHAIGGASKFRKKFSKVLFLIPLFVLAVSYFLLVVITKNNAIFTHSESLLKLFFDVAYPASDVIILTAALLVGVSFKFFGGKYKLAIYAILLGFCFQYVADFLFSYTTTASVYYTGGPVDLTFSIGLSLITFGVLGFYAPEE